MVWFRKMLVISAAAFAVLSAYGPADSLLEEAAFQWRILRNPDRAGQIYARVLVDYPEDAYALETARRGLKFCQAVTGRNFGNPGVNRVEALPVDSGLPLRLWRRAFSPGSVQNAAAAGKALALTTGDGYLVLANRFSGATLWARKGVNGEKPPAADETCIFAVDARDQLVAFSIDRGKIDWISDLKNVTSGPAAGGRKLVYCGAGNRAFAVNSKSGLPAWSVEFKAASPIQKTPLIAGENVLFTVPGAGVHLLNGSSGARLWSNSVESSLQPIASRGMLVLASGADIYALSLASGKMAWNLSGKWEITSLTVAESRFVVALDNSGEVKVADLSTGEVKSTFLAAPGGLVSLHDKIFLLDAKGRVVCRNFDGKQVWQFSTGETEGASLAATGDQLLVCTENSGLFALNNLYDRPEDARITDGYVKIVSLANSGMFPVALGQARYLLSEVEPGNPSLNRQYALLLQKNGETEKAFQVWEKFISVALPSEISETGALEELRALSTAKWVSALSSQGKFSPFYCVGGSIVALCEGEITVFDAQTGRGVWRYRLDSPGSLPQVAASSGSTLFVFGKNQLMCLDLDAQKMVWRAPFQGNVTSLCADAKGLVIGTWNQGLFWADTRTGRVARRFMAETKALFPLRDQGIFYCIGLEGSVAAFRDAREIFRMNSDDRFLAMPVIAGGTLVLPTAQGSLNAYKLKDGSSAWIQRVGVQAVSLAVDGERIFAVFTNQTLAAFDAHDGSRQWTFRAGGEGAEIVSAADGMVAVSGGNKINLYRGEDGSAVRTLKLAGRISSVQMSGKALFARLENGLIYRFDLY